MKKILITGSSGRIGQALNNELAGRAQITRYDIAQGYDATDYNKLRCVLLGHDVLVHLAFDLSRENSRTGQVGNPENLLMGQVALAAAAETGVETCIMGSSVNAARTSSESNLSYRTTKLALEEAAALQAKRYPCTQFASIRFGRVTADNQPPVGELRADQTWISHRDAANLVMSIVENPQPEHQIVNGVSYRPDMSYDIQNPYGWQPIDSFGVGA